MSAKIVGATSAEPAVLEAGHAGGTVHEDDRHGVHGMRRMRLAGDSVPHLFEIAVIGGDDEQPARRLDGLLKPAEAMIDRLRRLRRRGEDAAMAHHIAVGIIDDDEIELAALDRGDELVGHLRRRHFRLEIVGRDLGRGHENALFAREGLLLAAVEEIGDMGVFLGLGDAKLMEAGLGRHLAERAGELLGREQGRDELRQRRRIFDHAERGGEGDAAGAREALEGGVDQRRENLPHAVGAEIRRHQPVAVRHASIGGDRGRLDELVALAACVGRLDRGARILGREALPAHHRVIGERDALPALVAVHAVIASADGADGDALAVAEGGEEAVEIAKRAARRRVAPVEQSVHHDRNAGRGENIGECRDLILMRMHPARREQAQEMGAAATRLELGDEVAQARVARERAVLDRLVDARQILEHDPAGAEIHMSDLGIAHLALRQPDGMGRGVEERMRAARHQPIPDGRAGLAERVVLALLPVAPAVQDAEHDGARAAVCHHDALYRAIRPARPSGKPFDDNELSPAMVGMAGEDLLGTVELLEQHPAREQMRPGDAAEGDREISTGAGYLVEPVGAAQEKGEIGDARVAPGADAPGEPLARDQLAALVEGDHPRSRRQGRKQRRALARLALGGGQALFDVDLLEGERPFEPSGVMAVERELGPGLEAADGDEVDAHSRAAARTARLRQSARPAPRRRPAWTIIFPDCRAP